MKADIGDFETSRGYPLDLSAAATEIPGYEGCSAALQAAYNALPLGAQYVIRTGIATIPAGAVRSSPVRRRPTERSACDSSFTPASLRSS